MRDAEASGPQRDNPGDLIATYDIPYPNITGLAYVDGWIWGIAGNAFRLFALDPVTGEIVADYPIHNNPHTLAYDGELFWVGAGNTFIIYLYNLQGDLVEEIRNFQGTQFLGLTSDRRNLIYINSSNRRLMVVNKNDLQILSQIDYRAQVNWANANNIAFSPYLEFGSLWFNAGNQIYRLAFRNVNTLQQIQAFGWQAGSPSVGITNDGQNLWHGSIAERRLFVRDDGAVDTWWLRVEPAAGELNEAEDRDIILNLDARQFDRGVYQADLVVTSNDPVRPVVRIDVAMQVGDDAIIRTHPPVFPLPEARAIAFPNSFVGGEPAAFPLYISNLGSIDLQIEDIAFNNEAEFSLGIEPGFTIPAGRIGRVEVLFHPQEIGRLEGRIDLFTNAVNVGEGEDRGRVWLELTGTGITHPRLRIEPGPDQGFAVITHPEAEPTERQMVLSNVGDEGAAPLEFSIHSESEDEAENFSVRSVRSIRKAANPTPARDPAGELLQRFEVPYPQCSGMAWDGRRIWEISYSAHRLYAFDPEQAEVVCNVNIPFEPLGMTFDGRNLWVGFYPESILRCYNLQGELLREVNLPVDSVRGLACDHMGRMLVNCEPGLVHIYNMQNWDEIGRLTPPNIIAQLRAWNLLWVNCHRDSPLWLVGQNQITPLQVDENWQAAPRDSSAWIFIPNGIPPYVGLAHDGQNLWLGSWLGNLLSSYDDGVLEVDQLNWLLFNPIGGTLERGEEAEITLVFDPCNLEDGIIYQGRLVVEHNDPDQGAVNIPLQLAVSAQPRHFGEWTPTDYIHRIIVEDLTMRREPAAEGSEIGVFTPEGVLAGAVFWTSGEEGVGFDAYGDDPETQLVEGFQVNERFEFRVWDNIRELEWNVVDVEFLAGQETWINGELTRLTLDVRQERTLRWSLNPGWNMVSFNVLPPLEYWAREEGPDVIRLVQRLVQADEQGNPRQPLELLKDFEGRFYIPARNFLNLPFWNLAQAYALYLQEPAAVEWTGDPIPFDQPIRLTAGWNWLAFYPDYALSAAAPDYYVLSPLGGRLVMAKDLEGRFCSPEYNYSNMPPWSPGKGYMVQVSEGEPVDFSYPREQRGQAAAALVSDAEPLTAMTTETMSLLVNSISGLTEVTGSAPASQPQFKDIYLIAKSADGSPVGRGKLETDGRCGLAIWGDDANTPQSEGLKSQEIYALFISHAVKEYEIPLQISAFIQGEGLVYNKNSLTVVDAVIAEALPASAQLSAHPNPFNQTTRLRYTLKTDSRVQLWICDVQGRRVETLLNEPCPAGTHSVVWKADGLPGGIYIATLETVQGRWSGKLVMLK